MPESENRFLSEEELLTAEEIVSAVTLLAEMGVKKVRLTGGEPLLRSDIELLTARIKKISGIEKIFLTTNGLLLSQKLPALMQAGLDGVNISLDAMSGQCLKNITGKDAFSAVFAAISEAAASKIPVKVNCVPILELNGENFLELASLAETLPVDVRFIELMPIGMGKSYTGIPSDEILSLLQKKYGAAERIPDDTGNPALYYAFPYFKGRIGLISPMSHAFCKNCNRIRLTADGKLKLCLAKSASLDLKAMFRSDKAISEIKNAVENALKDKPDGHRFSDDAFFSSGETRTMNQIGG